MHEETHKLPAIAQSYQNQVADMQLSRSSAESNAQLSWSIPTRLLICHSSRLKLLETNLA